MITKALALFIVVALIPSCSVAQTAKKRPVAKPHAVVAKAHPFSFPVSQATHRVLFRDTIRVAGASVETLLARFADTYHRNYIYADYNLRNPRDTTNQLRPRQPAEPGETVTVATTMLVQPGQEATFVAGITPPEALRYAPLIHYLHFTLRFRAEPGVGYLTITDLYQRSTTMQKEMVRQYGIDLNSTAHSTALASSVLPPSTPIEELYWNWLPATAKATIKRQQPATEPVPTIADARLVASTVQRVLSGLRFNMAR